MPRSTRSSLANAPAKELAPPASIKTTKSARRSSRFVNNSSGNEMEIDMEDTKEVSITTTRRVFHAVVVTPKGAKGKGKVTSSRASSDSTVASTRDSPVVDLDTPATSVGDSPEPRLAPNFKIGGRSMNAGTKRKRGEDVARGKKPLDTTAQDEEIARQLQQQEYDSESSDAPLAKKCGATGKGKATAVYDSDEESALSELDFDSDDSLAFDPQPPRKKSRYFSKSSHNKTTKLEAKPTRRPQAGKTASTKLQTLDTLDQTDTDLSEAASEFSEGLGVFSGDSEDEDEDMQANDPMAAIRIAAKNRRQSKARFRRRGMQFEPGLDRRERRRAKLEKAHPEIKTMWQDLEKIPTIKPVPAPQPQGISRKLKGFQLEGLNWMTRQEQTHYKGGLLGDEMGMGKTIQAVSLIMHDHPAKDPTLVLVPPVALMQWANEINEYTNGKLKVLVCHGSNKDAKNLTVKLIRSYDVIIMSYNSLESMFRKQEKGWTRGENVVKEDSAIHAVNFHRLILDEAHSIKSRQTGIAKACFGLKGTYRWCLSGTPVQNRIGEFFSLLRFLGVRPFADYFCEACPCAQLHWSIDEDSYCKHCKHSGAEHRSVFNEELLNPITGESDTGRAEGMRKLHMITARMMLRRLKKDHTSSMELPPKEIVIHNEFFGAVERDFSSSVMGNTTRQFDTYVARGVMLNNYANIFGLIMQMRQVANHPDLLLKKHADGGQNVLVCNICDEPAEEAIKSRCHHEFCRNCAKTYVQSCEGDGTDADCPRCHIPLVIDWDQPDIEQDEEQVKKSSIINRIKMDNWTSSTKIEMLVYDLYKLRSKKQTLKSIVFSQFTSMLQLIEWRLRRAGFNTVMLDGSMTPAQRQKSIDYFMKNTDVEVFLVSLKAGGVALNLTEASRVFIIDPWWNPAAEWQSADRVHRIGQTRPCVITRLVIEDSVESRMVLLQEKKANMISASINNDKVAMDKLSPEDLQFLFRGT